MEHFAHAVDVLDAAVFSGDSLYAENNRNLLQRHIERWQRAIAEWKSIQDECENEEADGP